MNSLPTILEKIITRKKQEVRERSRAMPLTELQTWVAGAGQARGFEAAMAEKILARQPAVIAEVKKASPSRGIIRADFQAGTIARSYELGGATCLSVLTDEDFFQGSDVYLKEARAVTQLPVIRKDFIVDEYQVVESKVMGADCILLIAASMDASRLKELNALAQDLGMDVLVEVHNEPELDLALELPNRMIGINNRDLHTFEVSLDTTFRLLPRVPADKLVITESGIFSGADVKSMMEKNVFGFLVGESLMRATNPGAQLQSVFYGDGVGNTA